MPAKVFLYFFLNKQMADATAAFTTEKTVRHGKSLLTPPTMSTALPVQICTHQ